MNEKDEESERDADYKEWNYWQEQMNEKDEEGCEGGCVCCGFEDLKDEGERPRVVVVHCDEAD